MLTLNLHEGDYILLGDNIRVHFDHKVSRNILAVLVEAPRDILVLRGGLCKTDSTDKPRQQSAGIGLLNITLTKSGYIMIGDNIRVTYEKNKGEIGFAISIDAPKDVKIIRKRVYEKDVAQLAEKGDPEAKVLAERLQKEHEDRRKLSEARRSRQRFYLRSAKQRKAQ